jgi:predicted PurR-regulated permease PerM
MILLLQQAVTQEVEQLTNAVTTLNEATKQTSYSIVTGLVFLVVVMFLLGFLVVSMVNLLRQQANSLNTINEGIAVLLDRKSNHG